MSAEKKLFKKLCDLFDILTKYQILMFIICLGLLLICMAIDVVQKGYYPKCFKDLFTYVVDMVQKGYYPKWLGDLFKYDIGCVIAIVVVIWAFTASLSVHCLDKFGNRYYGISIKDVLVFDLKKRNIFALVSIILIDLFSLIFGAILELRITIIMIALQQFGVMIYSFLFVCQKTSYRYILKQIKIEMEEYTEVKLEDLVEQIKEIDIKNSKTSIVREPFLFKMIRNLDYSDIYSSNELLEVLEKSSEMLFYILQKEEQIKDTSNKENLLKLQKNIIIFSKYITSNIIDTAKTKKDILNFLYNWMEIENLKLEVKQGIIAALLEDLTIQNVEICQNLIKAEQTYQKELEIWRVVYNLYMQECVDEEWRVIYTKQFIILHQNWVQKDIEMVLRYWRYIDGTREIYTPLFKYIF